MTTPLRMYRLRMDRRELAVLGKRHHIPVNIDDSGYVVHAALAGLFTDAAPRPFAVDPDGASRDGALTVLGYGQVPLSDMLDRMRATADVQIANCLRVQECCEKLLPETWKPGASFAFRVRVCPVKRRSNGDNRTQERDAFLVWPKEASNPEAGTMARRRDCYAHWLKERTAGLGGATFDQIELESFQLARFVRRAGDKKRPVPNPRESQHSGASGRPDVLLSGTCTVTDSENFARLLGHGIGRHRAFGFGMLLLKPAG